MKTRWRSTAVLALVAQLGLWSVVAQDQDVDVKALLKRIEELEQKVKLLESQRASTANDDLEQKVKILERKGELAEEAAAEKTKSAPLVVIDSGGFQARSADTNFVFTLRGVLQVDNRTFFE